MCICVYVCIYVCNNISPLLHLFLVFTTRLNSTNPTLVGSMDGGRIGNAISPYFGLLGLAAGGTLVSMGAVHNPIFYLIMLGGQRCTPPTPSLRLLVNIYYLSLSLSHTHTHTHTHTYIHTHTLISLCGTGTYSTAGRLFGWTTNELPPDYYNLSGRTQGNIFAGVACFLSF